MSRNGPTYEGVDILLPCLRILACHKYYLLLTRSHSCIATLLMATFLQLLRQPDRLTCCLWVCHLSLAINPDENMQQRGCRRSNGLCQQGQAPQN